MRIIDGDISRSIYFVAVDSADYVTRETGLTGFSVYYSLDGGTATAMTSPSVTELDATNMPGIYRIDPPDAVFATGVDSAVIMLRGAANMAPVLVEIQLATWLS